MDSMTELLAVSVGIAEIEIEAARFAVAMENGLPDHEVGVYLDEMVEETVMVNPETGQVFNPLYPDQEVDLLDLVKPILAHVPTWKIDQYAAQRRAEEE